MDPYEEGHHSHQGPRVHRHTATSTARGSLQGERALMRRRGYAWQPGSEIDRRFQADAGAPMLGGGARSGGMQVCFFSSWGGGCLFLGQIRCQTRHGGKIGLYTVHSIMYYSRYSSRRPTSEGRVPHGNDSAFATRMCTIVLARSAAHRGEQL